jgi:hypothetical protein
MKQAAATLSYKGGWHAALLGKQPPLNIYTNYV